MLTGQPLVDLIMVAVLLHPWRTLRCCAVLLFDMAMDDVVLFVLILLTKTQDWCCDHLKMIAMQGNNTTSRRQIGGSSRSSCSLATSVSYSLATSVSENNLESDKYKAHQDLLIHRSSVRFWNSLEK